MIDYIYGILLSIACGIVFSFGMKLITGIDVLNKYTTRQKILQIIMVSATSYLGAFMYGAITIVFLIIFAFCEDAEPTNIIIPKGPIDDNFYSSLALEIALHNNMSINEAMARIHSLRDSSLMKNNPDISDPDIQRQIIEFIS
jgi:hypothetical protein